MSDLTLLDENGESDENFLQFQILHGYQEFQKILQDTLQETFCIFNMTKVMTND